MMFNVGGASNFMNIIYKHVITINTITILEEVNVLMKRNELPLRHIPINKIKT